MTNNLKLNSIIKVRRRLVLKKKKLEERRISKSEAFFFPANV